MKRIISVTVFLTFLAASVFAVPVTNAVSPLAGENNQKTENNLEADLFSNVQATALTDLEMEAVEGEIGILAIFGLCLLGAGIGAGFALLGISLIL